MKQITVKELFTMTESKNPPRLIDSQQESEFTKEHLPGALCLSEKDVETQAPKLIKSKSDQVVVYGAHAESMGAKAIAGRLTGLGYSNVSTLSDGKAGWLAEGHPVECNSSSDAESKITS